MESENTEPSVMESTESPDTSSAVEAEDPMMAEHREKRAEKLRCFFEKIPEEMDIYKSLKCVLRKIGDNLSLENLLLRGSIEACIVQQETIFLREALIREISRRYVVDISEVIEDAEGMPGQMTYDQWLIKMDIAEKREEFERIICSACSCCDAAWEGEPHVECTLQPGKMIILQYPYVCPMMEKPSDRDAVLKMVQERHGEEKLGKFLEKEKVLKRERADAILSGVISMVSDSGLVPLEKIIDDFRFLTENGFNQERESLASLLETYVPGIMGLINLEQG